ncbi:MAG: UDP-N-acetylmuramate dehydrogenase [Actinomycetota bacterium]
MKIKALKNEPLSMHTTWQIGGPASLFAQVTDTDELIETLAEAEKRNLPVFVIGNGSNLLVADKGFKGLVIKLRGGFSGFTIKHNVISAEAGVKLGSIVTAARQKSLSGISFAAGIPGTIGGALVMNAGGNDGTVSDIVETLTVLNPQGEIEKLTRPDIKFGYRESGLKGKGIILNASFRLEAGNPESVTKEIVEKLDQKRRTQPIEARTAGSVFKNPGNKRAAALIEAAGCKGMRIGGAVVSRMHANFILSVGGATAKDVVNLIDEVAAKVKSNDGIDLKREVEFVGEF